MKRIVTPAVALAALVLGGAAPASAFGVAAITAPGGISPLAAPGGFIAGRPAACPLWEPCPSRVVHGRISSPARGLAAVWNAPRP